ncbi:uncharacterized protein LOC115755985 [Rhodamnia argentea]|uniref:Uncharacterized protein LOC115755985 n=1 Tax=Rhodamnia argentea TaxID=178133 RepID=A0ABM3HXQ5_9MYRT|nr:uncharacterized protein LOC115755985 [Rhodamnia argentea]
MMVPNDLPEPVLGINFARDMLFQMINELPTVCESVKEFGKPNDQSNTTMLQKPESCSTVEMSSPHKDESDHCGSSSFGQNKSSATYVNSSADDSRAQKDKTGAAIEDGHIDGSSSRGQILWNACE